MTEWAKKRRNDRHGVSHRLRLRLTDPARMEEVINTLDVSLNGARVLARGRFPPESRGTVELVETGRRVPCRVVWRAANATDQGLCEMGLELGLEPETFKSLWE